VILRFTPQNVDRGWVSAVAQPVERDRFQVGGHSLSLAGPWRVDVVVRRKGVADSIAQFDWIVAPPGALRPVVISKAPLASMFTVAAAGTLVTVLLLAVLAWLGLSPGYRGGGGKRIAEAV